MKVGRIISLAGVNDVDGDDGDDDDGHEKDEDEDNQGLSVRLGASWQRGRVLWAAPWEQPSPPLKTIIMIMIMIMKYEINEII